MSSYRDLIDNANKNFEQIFARGDFKALSELYTTDSILYPSGTNGAVLVGREAVQNFWEGANKAGVKNIELLTGSVSLQGEILVEESAYRHSLGTGRFIVLWKKDENNNWFLWRDIFN
eukprot:TRINITY_DN156_c1_g2_i1.p1 TRINITY_DN156_c1_g2~~TRINITY_DN156_c1_g2_i1.p1  ORF type:complete len:118 (-),score=42.95 TRINITY_DN156_c1_g2_i1:71-424(-)